MNPDPAPSRVADHVLFSVVYGDVFNFALHAHEIVRYLPLIEVDLDEIQATLAELVKNERLVCSDGLYTLPGRAALAGRRRERLPIQKQRWTHLEDSIETVARLPSVLAGYVTGSLAADNADPEADIDLFLVTQRRRVFTTLYRLRVQRALTRDLDFCSNYIIAEDNLSLLNPNFYTAVEWRLAVPIGQTPTMQKMEEANRWTREWLPGQAARDRRRLPGPSTEPASRRTSIRNRLVGTALDVLDWLLYNWVRFRSKGKYTPSRHAFKPHPPHRQHNLFRRLLQGVDSQGLDLPRLRDHLVAEEHRLEIQLDAWTRDEQKGRARVAAMEPMES